MRSESVRVLASSMDTRAEASLISSPDPGQTGHILPASQTLAKVVNTDGECEVHLPVRFARSALEKYLQGCYVKATVIEEPPGALPFGRELGANEWAVRIELGLWWNLGLSERDLIPSSQPRVYVFPKFTVRISKRRVARLLHALEQVKPEELDADGRPLPWVPDTVSTVRLGMDAPAELDEVTIGVPEPSAPAPDDPSDDGAPITNREIHRWFDWMKSLAGYPAVRFTLQRGTVNRCGFTSGRVWLSPGGAPHAISITTCPNSDPAEICATLVHEFAHPLSGRGDHGLEFKHGMVEFAGRCYGHEWFAGAREHVKEKITVVDGWIAAGIREAILQDKGRPPLSLAVDDIVIAEIATKIRKARALGFDRVGTPEGIRATSAANQLVTIYGLSEYRVRHDAADLDRMMDRWIVLSGHGVWRQELGHAIAKAFDVFSLVQSVQGKRARMHLWGRRSDVMQAEYLFSLTQARIDRECETHLAAWRRSGEAGGAGAARSERTSFCDSAVAAFSQKLKELVEREDLPGRTQKLTAAETFSRDEHAKRGIGWASGGARSVRENAAGREFGESLEFTRGVGGIGQEPKRLSGPPVSES